MRRTLYLKLLRWLQSKCQHPDYAVRADILEGKGIDEDYFTGRCVQWCEICGAFRFKLMHAPVLGAMMALEWREPRPDWHTPAERKEYLKALNE